MFSGFANSFVTLFVIMDPIGVAVIFSGLMREMPVEARRGIAKRGTGVAGILLLAFGFGGAPLLGALGISLPALRIAGGVLLFLLATDMVFARHTGIRNPTGAEQEEAARRSDVAVFPIAFPLLAGPGALTSIVLLMGHAAAAPLAMAGVILALAAALGLTYLSLLFAAHVVRLLGITGANVIGRVFGIVLAALAAQYVLDGVTQALPNLIP